MSLLKRPLHTVGMIAGITLAVAAAAATVIISGTQDAQVNRRFDLQRSTHVVLKAEAPLVSGFDANGVRLLNRLEVVKSAGEFSIWSDGESVSRSFGEATALAVPLLVADPDGLAASETAVTDGALLDLIDDKTVPHRARLAWIGKDLASELGVGPASAANNVDDSRDFETQILVSGVPLSIAGVLNNTSGFEYVNRSVLVTRRVAHELFGGVGSNVRALVHVRPGAASSVAAFALPTLDPGRTMALNDVTPPDGEVLVGLVSSDVKRFGTALVGFMTVVGMVTITNTLLMSVLQRHRELGLRSAIGWSRRRVGALVLFESVLAGLMAGALGAAFGMSAGVVWAWHEGATPIVPRALPFLLVFAAVLLSAVGGLLPARRAASIAPLEAMRA